MTAFFSRSQCVNPEARRNVPEPSRDQSDAESVWLVPDRFQPLQAVLENIYANIYFTPTHHRHPISRSYGARHGAYAVRNSENIRRPITAPNITCIYKICNPISINHTWLKAIMCSCFFVHREVIDDIALYSISVTVAITEHGPYFTPTRQRHPISRPHGRDMGRMLWEICNCVYIYL